jgi:hypothetical protein
VSTEFRRLGIPRNFLTSEVISAQFRRNSAKFRGIPRNFAGIAPEITSVFRGMPKCHFRGHPKYPTVDASPTIYRQASSALLNLIKNIVTVKGLTITKDSYSYILELAMSSNVIANQFILSESQQFSLLLDSLPANSSEFAVLNRCANLEDLFETISTFAPSIPTQRDSSHGWRTFRILIFERSTFIIT